MVYLQTFKFSGFIMKPRCVLGLLKPATEAQHSLLDLDLDSYIPGTVTGRFCNGTGRAPCKIKLVL